MIVSSVTLPPLVGGPQRGSLLLSLGPPQWNANVPSQLRQAAQARVHWWGDDSGGELVALPISTGTAAATAIAFPLHTGPKYLIRYLQDMGSLNISVEPAGAAPSSSSGAAAASCSATRQAATAKACAAASVCVTGLDVQAPVSGSYTLLLSTSPDSGAAVPAPTIVGSLSVRLELDYRSAAGGAALISSFELNEHLADASGVNTDFQEEEAEAGSSGSAQGGDAAGAAPASEVLGAPGVCTELAAALEDRNLVTEAVGQVQASRAEEHGTAEGGEESLLTMAEMPQMLPLLLPTATQQQLEYAAAMLGPWPGAALGTVSGSSCNDGWSVEQLVAEATECAAIEQQLQQQPAIEVARHLRRLAAALGSRSLDLAASFAAAEGQQLSLPELGHLLQHLCPAAALDEARCLLAVVAGPEPGTSSRVTLPALKAALASVQEALQFPTADDLERQQAAAAARRAKEAAAVAVAAAPQPQRQQLDRRQAMVSKLKSSSLQQRRRSSSSGGSSASRQQSQQQEGCTIPVAAQHAGQPPSEQRLIVPGTQTPPVPAVVVGIPVLPPPPPALLSELLQPAGPQLGAAVPAAPVAAVASSAVSGNGSWPAAAAANEPSAMLAPAVPRAAQSGVEHDPASAAPDSQQPAEPPVQQRGTQQDLLVQLIQQAEQLKADLEQASSGRKGSCRSLLAATVCPSRSAAPSLPNLLLPPELAATSGTSSSAGLAAAVADGSLSAATAALVAAAKALREESERLPPPGTTVAPAAVVSAVLAASSTGSAPKAALSQPGVAAASAAAALGAVDSSDPESDAEDALLESLFFSKPAVPAAATQAGAASSPQVTLAPSSQQHQQESNTVLRVQLGALDLASGHGTAERISSVRCVVKPLRRGGQVHQFTLPVGSCRLAAWHGEVLLPPTAGAELGTLPPYLFLEFWRHSGSLLGVAKVPLLQPASASGIPCAAGAFGQPRQADEKVSDAAAAAAVVAEGRHAVSNILELDGSAAGSVYVAAVLQDLDAPPQVAATRHCFSVNICSALRLPSTAAYVAADLRAPDGRLLRYSFPGEPDALQTREVACCSNPSFEATANHEMVLPASHSILPLLQDGLLRFDLFDCWADSDTPRQHGWAALPLSELASLVTEAERSSGGGSSGGSVMREASRVVLLPLCTEYDLPAASDAGDRAAGLPGGRGPSLKIEVAYSGQLCTMDAAEAAEAESAQGSGRSACSPAKQAMPPPPPQQTVQDQQGHEQHTSGCTARSNYRRQSDDENSSEQVNGIGGGGGQQTLRRHRQTAGSPGQQSPEPSDSAAAAAPAAASVPQPAEPSVPATLSVDVIRASGLAAAVRAAAAAAGNADSGLATALSRAAAVGPHAFARFSLFPGDSDLEAQAPPLQTAFVAQSFNPAWRASHEYQLQLTAGMLGALAAKSLRVEVWHRCSRGVALSASGGGGGGQREVLLGAGSVPLLDVLRKRRGLRCWVALSPQEGSSSGVRSTAGAVELAVRLSELAGMPAAVSSSLNSPEESLLLSCPAAAALLPPALRAQLLLPPGSGFGGQLAVLALHLDTLVPPGSSGSRPKADRYFCKYSLPWTTAGRDSTIASAGKVLTSSGSGANPNATTGGGTGVVFGSSSGSAGRVAQQQQWAASMQHSGFFEVPAGPALVAALLQAPLRVSVYKQPASAGASRGSVPGGSRSEVLVGTAEVDLSPLLWPVTADDSGDGQRSVAGKYPLLEGAAASQGGASLAAQAELQLAPMLPAAEQAAAAAAAGVDVACRTRDGDEEQQQQQLCRSLAPQRQVLVASNSPVQPRMQGLGSKPADAKPTYPESSSSDDDEELLRRCRQLTRNARHAARRSQQPPAAARPSQVSSSAGSASPCSSPGAFSPRQPVTQQQQSAQACDSRPEEVQQQQQPADPAGSPATGATSGTGQQHTSASGKDTPGDATPQMPGRPNREAHGEQDDGEDGAGENVGLQQPPGPQPGEVREGSLWVQVETALRLPESLPGAVASDAGSGAYLAHVQTVWQRQGGQQQLSQRTTSVPVHPVQSASLGGTAVWQQGLELGPMSASAWDEGSPGSRGSGASSGPTLLLNVWAAPADSEHGDAAAGVPVLLGCTVVELGPLLWQGEVHGWFQLIDSHRQHGGQLKASVRPDAVLARQLAGVAAGAGDRESARAPPSAAGQAAQGPGDGQSEDLQQQLATQLQELELLSRRLNAAPAASAAGSTQPSQQQQSVTSSRAPLVAEAESAARNQQPFLLRETVASDGEDDAAPFDARQTGFAWSGSDSDADDDMALLGVAVEGAVSPGFSDADAEEEAQRSRQRGPRPPQLLVGHDWLFDIAKPSAAELEQEEQQQLAAAAAAAALADESPGVAEEQGGGHTSRRRVVFRNVIPGACLDSRPMQHLSASSSEAVAAAPQGPHAAQWPAEQAPASRPPEGEQQQEQPPQQPRQQLMQRDVPAGSASAEPTHPGGLFNPDWAFDIARPPSLPAAASAGGQFSPMLGSQQGQGQGQGQGAELAAQREQLAQHTQHVRGEGRAATLDEVLESLRPRRAGGSGAMADSSTVP